MSSPWGKIQLSPGPVSLQEIMSEEFAKELQMKEDIKYSEIYSEPKRVENDPLPKEYLEGIENVSENMTDYDSDAFIAQMLQYEFDKEHDEELKRIENKKNGMSKVSVSYVNLRKIPEELLSDSDDDIDGYDYEKKDWDRFETNEKQFSAMPRCGYRVQEGKLVTKHDATMAGCRNACRVMAFPPEFHTGDGAGFEMQLPNRVFNSLKAHARQEQSRRNRIHDRKEDHATAEMGVDERTRLLLYKMINSQLLERVNGVISTGKEAVILHADTDPAYGECVLPKECAIKVFKTTLNDFKTRDKYIKHDYRFKDRFSKQNPRKIIHLWAEKEMHNLMKMHKIGINVPDVIGLKKHILVMSFIGENHRAAPKLKEAVLSAAEWILAYDEVETMMHKLYNEAGLVHADLSEYNILWFDKKCWFIDVSQSVEPRHPSGLEFLMRDCNNISLFFSKKDIPGVRSAHELFSHITNLDPNTHNTGMLERMHLKGAPPHIANRPNPDGGPDEDKPLVYPFDYAWEKSINKPKEELEQGGKQIQVEYKDVEHVTEYLNVTEDKVTSEENKSIAE